MADMMVDTTVLDTLPVLKKLIRIEESDNPLLSAYLSTGYQDEHSARKLKIFLKNRRSELLSTPKYAGKVEPLLVKLEKALEALPPSVRGWAVFIRDSKNPEERVFVAFESDIPFQNDITVNHVPNILQLLRLSENHETVLAVMLDSRSARILRMALNRILGEETLETEVPGWHNQGGWSQLRYQHHIQERKEIHYKKVAEHVVTLMDAGLYSNLVLLGETENVAALKRHLPERTLQRIEQSRSLPMYESNAQVLDALQDMMGDVERGKEHEALREVVDLANAGGLGTVVLSEVLTAIPLGQIDRLYLQEDFNTPGWRCPACQTMGLYPENEPVAETLACPVCGETVRETALGEEMALAVKRMEGTVEFLQEVPIHELPDGIAARLRFR